MRTKRISKLGFIFIALVSSLTLIGVSYSGLTDSIQINGTVTTDVWEEAEGNTAWARMYDNASNFTYEFPGSSWATYIIHQPTEDNATFYLYASQHYRVGELIIWKNTTHLIVKYDLDEGYNMSESQLHIATSLAGIPQTKTGNPKIGNFDYSENHDPRVAEYTYTIPWDQSWNNLDLYIAAHAVVWGIYS